MTLCANHHNATAQSNYLLIAKSSSHLSVVCVHTVQTTTLSGCWPGRRDFACLRHLSERLGAVLPIKLHEWQTFSLRVWVWHTCESVCFAFVCGRAGAKHRRPHVQFHCHRHYDTHACVKSMHHNCRVPFQLHYYMHTCFSLDITLGLCVAKYANTQTARAHKRHWTLPGHRLRASSRKWRTDHKCGAYRRFSCAAVLPPAPYVRHN